MKKAIVKKKKTITSVKKDGAVSAQITGEIDTNLDDRRLKMFKLELELLCLKYNLLVGYCVDE